MAEIVKQFLKVQNFNNWTDDKKNEVNEKGQIVFVPGATRSDVVDVNAIYANGDVFGDGALSNKTVLTQGFKVEGGPLSDLLKDKGITTVVSALDNDKAGNKGTEYLKQFFHVIRFAYPEGIKDAGEMSEQELKVAIRWTREAYKRADKF